ncbi:hypothetical protein D3C77_382740 [compost metagenome]
MGNFNVFTSKTAYKRLEFGPLRISKLLALLDQCRIVFFPLDFIGSGITAIALDPCRQVRAIGVYTEQIGNQPAARMAHQLQYGSSGQLCDYLQRIVDRALREGAMFKSGNLLAEFQL